MSDYLNNLVARTLNPSRVVQPRLASRFEPDPAGPQQTLGFFELETEEGETRPSAPTVEAPSRVEREPRAQAEHSPSATVFEKRPDSNSNQQAPAQATEHASAPKTTPHTPVEKEMPKPMVVNVEAVKNPSREEKSPSREESSRVVHEAAREVRPSSEPVKPIQAPRVAPRVVEPRVSPAPKANEAQSPQAPASRAAAAPTIRVTIGRVDVRAVAAAPKEARRAPEPPRPALTLEDYLRRRGGGSR